MPGCDARRLAVLLLLLCAPMTAARANEFTDFRVPANQFLQWTGSMGGSVDWSNTTVGADHRALGSSFGALSSALSCWHETDTRSMSLTAFGLATGSRSHMGERIFFDNFDSPVLDVSSRDESRRDVSGHLSFASTQRWYPGGGGWDLAVDVDADLNDAQSWDRSQSSRVSPLNAVDLRNEISSDAGWAYQRGGSGSFGGGLGRVRNATGVYEARVLEDRLRRSGALTRPLGAVGRKKLAALMYARGEFDATMDRPTSRLWDALEKILVEDGALRSPAPSAGELFHLTERYIGGGYPFSRNGLPSSPIFRAVGWNIGIALLGRTNRYWSRDEYALTQSQQVSGVPQPPTEYRFGRSAHQSDDVFSAAFSGEYHRPVSMRVQWDVTADGSVPLRKPDRGSLFNAGAGLGCIVADRWLTTLAAQHRRTIAMDDHDFTWDDSWSTRVFVGAQYFVADHVTLGASASQAWSKERSDRSAFVGRNPGQAIFFNRGSLNFGLTYRFAGFARIEGVYPPGVPLN